MLTRAGYHLIVLALVAVMTAGAAAAQWDVVSRGNGGDTRSGRASGVDAAPPLIDIQPTPPLIAPTALPVLVGPVASPIAMVVPPRPTVRWIQNFRVAELFGGPDLSAPAVSKADQFTTFELVEQLENGRSRLRDPGRGEGALPGFVWADLASFGPSGPPIPEYELAGDTVVAPASGRLVIARQTAGWPKQPTAEMAVVLDGDSGAVLYGKNAHVRAAPASLTKIVTAIVAVEKAGPRDMVKVDVDSRDMAESTVMGLTRGETVSMETLLYGLMLPSGNDAALAIARYVSGSEARFVDAMNDKAAALGMLDSRFRNPHGLDADGHYSSAYDLAWAARYGMQIPLFHNASAALNWRAEGYNLWNLNKLIGHYPGADGVKVGFTDNAGRCLVASATRDGHRVIVAVIRSQDPTSDSRALLDYAFQSFRWLQSA